MKDKRSIVQTIKLREPITMFFLCLTTFKMITLLASSVVKVFSFIYFILIFENKHISS
jgi:hypothetical protein